MSNWLKRLFSAEEPTQEAMEAEEMLQESRRTLKRVVKETEEKVGQETKLARADVERARRVIQLTEESLSLIRGLHETLS